MQTIKTSWLPILVAVLCNPCLFGQASFDLRIEIANPTAFTASELQTLQRAIVDAETMWEGTVIGYQPEIQIDALEVEVVGTTGIFADASATSTDLQGGFRLSRKGRIRIGPDTVSELADWQGSGVNTVDELMAHEIGHLLGIGTHWEANGVYEPGSGKYTGEHGLAAYRLEFDSEANFVPVELNGRLGTKEKHWDQIMRSDAVEGNPDDPFSLSPLLGITDSHGRDLALELMTGAIDPDYGEPFLSNTTIQSLRDLGYVVVPEPSSQRLAIGLSLTVCTLLRKRHARSLGKRRQPAFNTNS